MIPQRWYKDYYQDESIPESPICNYKIGVFNDRNILPIRKPATIPTTIPTLKKSIYKRNLYGCVWGLAREATLLVVEQDDKEIVTYLQGYISRKHKEKEKEHNTAPERSTTEKIPDNAWEVQTSQSSDQSEDESKVEDKKDIEKSLKNVKNPNKVDIKGRPPKRQYISSVEKEQGHRGGSKSRGTYKCGICNQMGHNAAFHKNKGRIKLIN
ncbi:hypothetical protein C2G38_2033379 [Gigaspora rosea]|uniref:CCHC-type domain-containing protein n=1 Tax=Gigaspora rosea TaxID=44941 RepID=A0A397VN03_9GLOM|nr:hypothetical protein C2G38_2033379 [Gigaspora rosea]